MVSSLAILTKKDAQFSFLWRLATCRKSKIVKFDKKSILNHGVRKACESIRRIIETNSTEHAFGLYIISQLVYGTTVLYSKHVDLFFHYVEEVVERIKHHFFDFLSGEKKLVKRKKRNDIDEDYKTPRKRSKNPNNELEDFDLDVIPSSKMTNIALAQAITLKEDLCVLRTPTSKDIWADDDELPEMTAEDFQMLYGTNEGTLIDHHHSSCGNHQGEEREYVQSRQNKTSNQIFHFDRPSEDVIRQSEMTPSKCYSKDKLRFSPAPELEQVLRMGIDGFDQNNEESMNFEKEMERRKKFITEQSVHDESAFIPPIIETSRSVSYGLALTELPENHFPTPLKTPIKRRRDAIFEKLKITHAEMREMQNDYSRLVHENAEKLLVDEVKVEHLTLKQLLHPSPYWRLKTRFAPCLSSLYESCVGAETKFDSNLGTIVGDEKKDDEKSQNSVKNDIDLDKMCFFTTPLKENILGLENDEQIEVLRNFSRSITPIQNSFEILSNNEVLQQSRNDQITPSKSIVFDNMNDIKNNHKVYWSKEEIRSKILKTCQRDVPYPSKFNDILEKNCGPITAARSFYVLLEMMKEKTVVLHKQSEPFGSIEICLKQSECYQNEEDIEKLVEADEAFVE